MNCISTEQCLDWMVTRLNSSSIQEIAYGKPILPLRGYDWIEKKPLPSDSGKKVNLARVALSQFENEPRVLVWIQDWQIWPSSGHIPLANRLRESLGENRALSSCPGHLFEKEEMLDAISLLILGLQFYWDVLIVPESAEAIFYTSHDEYFIFQSHTEASLRDFLTAL